MPSNDSVHSFSTWAYGKLRIFFDRLYLFIMQVFIHFPLLSTSSFQRMVSLRVALRTHNLVNMQSCLLTIAETTDDHSSQSLA